MTAVVKGPLDTLVRAEAPEGILLELRPAGAAVRLYAFLIDLLIRFAIMIGASIVLGLTGKFGTGLLLILMFCIEWFYPVLFELRRAGATPGKRAMGLRVVMDNGLPVTPAASITRNLLRVADFLPFAYAFAALCMLARQDFKRLGDLAAGTLVIYDTPPSLVQTNGQLPNAEPRAPARPLSVREQAVLVALATRSSRLTPERVDELAALAAPATGAPENAPYGLASARLFGVAQWLFGRRIAKAAAAPPAPQAWTDGGSV